MEEAVVMNKPERAFSVAGMGGACLLDTVLQAVNLCIPSCPVYHCIPSPPGQIIEAPLAPGSLGILNAGLVQGRGILPTGPDSSSVLALSAAESCFPNSQTPLQQAVQGQPQQGHRAKRDSVDFPNGTTSRRGDPRAYYFFFITVLLLF